MRDLSLIAHWLLRGNAEDARGQHHGAPHNLQFTDGSHGTPNGAALFDESCGAHKSV